MFSLPSSTAPASFSRRTISASCLGTRSLNKPLAAVVRTPAVSNRSLSAMGTPWSGPRQWLRWISASASRACASADSAVTVINALSFGLSRSMRFRHDCVSSTGETFLSRMRREASLRLSHVPFDAGAAFDAWLPIGLALPRPLIKATAVADRLLTNVLREQPDWSLSFMQGIIRQYFGFATLDSRIGGV